MRTPSRLLLAAPVAAACLLSSACVTAKKYKALDLEARASAQRAEALEAKLKEAQKSLGDLEAKLKAGGDQLASLQTSNKDLQESLEAKKGELTKKVADLIKERDGLAQQLNDERAQLAAAARKAADEEAARKALEAEKAAELERARRSYEELAAGLKAEIAAGEIKLTELKGRLTVNMVDRILFDSGESAVKPDGRKVLKKVGQLLSSVKGKDIRIEGHTDDRPIVGELKARYATNWELSTARATAVARYLQDEARLEPARLVAAGYGEYRPVASNETPEGRALNRRIEIVLVAKDQ